MPLSRTKPGIRSGESLGHTHPSYFRVELGRSITNYRPLGRALGSQIGPDRSGGLNGSVQHLLAVYLPEFQNPKFFLDVDLSVAQLCRDQLENTLTSLFF